MILLDTNVISEPMKPESDPRVDAWFDRHNPANLFLTAISLSEILYGIARTPEGRRKQGLDTSFRVIRRRISTTVLPFDEAAALVYYELMARTRASGFALSEPDGQIAAIAQVHGCTVATREVEPFLAAGIAVLNPWEDS